MLVDPRDGRYVFFYFFLPQKTMGIEGKTMELWKRLLIQEEIPNNHRLDGVKNPMDTGISTTSTG